MTVDVETRLSGQAGICAPQTHPYDACHWMVPSSLKFIPGNLNIIQFSRWFLCCLWFWLSYWGEESSKPWVKSQEEAEGKSIEISLCHRAPRRSLCAEIHPEAQRTSLVSTSARLPLRRKKMATSWGRGWHRAGLVPGIESRPQSLTW